MVTRYVSRVVMNQKNIFPTFDNIFHVYFIRTFQEYARTSIPMMAAAAAPDRVKDHYQMPSYLAAIGQKNHHKFSISCIYICNSLVK